MKITVRRTRIELSPYTIGDSFNLERKLMLWDNTAHGGKGGYSTKYYKYDEESKTFYVPIGFGLEEITALLALDNIYDCEIDYRLNEWTPHREIALFNIKDDYGLRDKHQEGFVNFLLEETYPIRLLAADTGYGKTFCTVYAASQKKIPVMIVLNLSILIEQWKRNILDYTDCIESELCTIRGKDKLYSYLKPKNNKGKRFYIVTAQTLVLAAKDGDLERILEAMGVGIMAFDEAHKLMDANNTIMLNSNVRYTYLLTATPKRTSWNEDIMYSRIINKIPKFGEYTVFLSKYTNTVNLFIATDLSSTERANCIIYKGISPHLYEQTVFSNIKRALYLYGITKRLILKMMSEDPEARILVILSTIDVMSLMKNMTELGLTEYGISVGELNSKIVNKAKREEEKNKSVIFTSVGSAGAGMDLKNLRAIVSFSIFSSEVTLHQLFGRLRKIPKKAVYYFNVIDESMKSTYIMGVKRSNYLKNRSNSIKSERIKMTDVLKYISDDPQYDNLTKLIENFIVRYYNSNKGKKRGGYRFSKYKRRKSY